MDALLADPLVQAGFAPLAAALVAASLLQRWRLAGLALLAALATTLALTVGIGFTPLTAARKVVVVVAAAAALGVLLDATGRDGRALPWVAGALAAAAVFWVFQSVLGQREGADRWLAGAGVALFVGAAVGLMARLRGDDAGLAAAALGLNLAVAVSALLSASIGNMMNAMALAAAAGALLLLQFAGRSAAPGWTGALVAGAGGAGFAAASHLLAELRWPTLALLLAVPAVASLPLAGARSPRVRLVARTLATLACAALPVASAWLLAAG